MIFGQQYSVEMYTSIAMCNAKIPIIVWNSRGIIIATNEAAALPLGYKVEELLGQNFSKVLPEDKGNTNEYIHQLSQNSMGKPPISRATATLTPRNADEVYVLYAFGLYLENEQDRYILAYHPTSVVMNPKNALKNTRVPISWLFWS